MMGHGAIASQMKVHSQTKMPKHDEREDAPLHTDCSCKCCYSYWLQPNSLPSTIQ
eukprot:m.156428 g.156428  ORF g.156428 m.156428 type:complete len:55 (-) comp16440_c0_seq10:90-254(-)